MKYFAHIEEGPALEPQPADSPDLYIKYVGGGRDTSAWKVESVPDDTQHGAKPDGQGGWVNPKPTQPDPPVQDTTKQQILDQIGVLNKLADSLP